jgi:hypothetical protein
MEGNQVILLLLKMLSMLANKIATLIEKAAISYLQHCQKKRELGLKKGKVLKADKVELLIAKTIKKNLLTKEKVFEEKVRVSKFKLDCYKLEMQSELADLEKNIRVLQVGLDNAKDQTSKDMIHKELNNSIKEKTNFEKDVNRTLLEKNKEINSLENEYNRIKKGIETCDKAIDGFASKISRDMTESMRSNFESLVKEESFSQSKEAFEHTKEQEKAKEQPSQQNQEKPKEQPKEQSFQQQGDSATINVNFEKEVSNEVSTEASTGIERDVETDSISEVDKKFAKNHEKEPTKIHKEPVKTSTEIDKNDEFMKEYLETQKRKSLAKEKQKELALER